MQFRINTPPIIYEILDGEAVILNLDKGIYYSLNEVGKEIWRQIGAHYTWQEMVDSFHSDQGEEFVKNGVLAFLTQLEEEKIIVEDKNDSVREKLTKKPFNTPHLQIYHDMKDLLLLDPIHEVDQAGWPVAP